MTRIGVFGLGEAGSEIARDLAQAGTDVHAYDPADLATPSGVVRHDDPETAVSGADLVLAVTASADAAMALGQALHAMPGGTIYADMSTSSPELKLRLARVASNAGIDLVDVALMSTVPGKGLRTPALVSGPRAGNFVSVMRPLGMPVEAAGDRVGQAATRKLLRSVVMKGMASLIIESMRAAEAAGLAEETWENVISQLADADEALVRRLVSGTGPHALRRLDEMEAAVELLSSLGVDPTMTSATVASLRRVAINGLATLPQLP